MTKRLRFDDEAVEELEAAARFYEAHRDRLGRDFVAAVREALVRIVQMPATFPLMPDMQDLGVRRLLVRRFPYSIVYVELDDELRILAVAHSSREPGFWRSRL